jgi:hypothetical protein
MGFSDANQLLSGPRQPIAKFDSIGDTVTGTLVDAEVAPVTSPTGEVKIVEKNKSSQSTPTKEQMMQMYYK